MTGSAVAPATMTCCSGSSVSSASETTKVAVASSSSSLIVGSALTSFSNCSSGRSGRIFLPSGPITTSTAASRPGPRPGGALLGRSGLLAVRARPSWPGRPWSCRWRPPWRRPSSRRVAVFFVVVAAATRAPVTSTWTEMPRRARCARRPLRCRGSTWAASLARRTSSGLRVPRGPSRPVRRRPGG